jgi:hydrogenase nickel incorporation protein HypA/HybF
MHELAIAEAVIRIASDHAAGRPVRAVFVKVGQVRQVVPAALRFSFELAAAGTPVAGARLEIEHVPAAGLCRACGHESALEAFPFACAACGGLEVALTRGEELLVDSLELDDEMAVSA